MHVALITAPTITEFRTPEEIASRAVQQAALQPQLGVLSVAAILEQWGDTPHLLDANAEYLDFASSTRADRIDDFAQHLAERAVRSNADVYGFSSICSTFPLSLRVARAVKQLRPYASILFGGPQVSVVDQPVMQHFPFVDFVLRGEVEESLPLFLQQLTSDYRFGNVPGLTYRDGAAVIRTPNAPVIEDLDTLLPPSYHLSNYLRRATSASIELGRGCPFACTFCSTNDFFRRRYRLRSPDRVLKEMRSIAATYGIRHFELVHDMFTVDRKRVIAFCKAMRDSGEHFTWDCSARTDCVDEALLEEMAASGCRGLFFGIESGSVRVQRSIDKDLDPAYAEEMLRAAERLGLRTTASLIVGFPQEDWTDVDDTLHVYTQSARCAQSHPQINLLAPLAGTPLHTQHAHELQLDEVCSDMSHQGLSQAEDDLALIREFPDIFPNFYTVSAPSLDRTVLFDLREFLGMAVAHHRWLLCAVAQRTSLRLFHRDWMTWRHALRGNASPGELRRYYAEPTSRQDLLRFIAESDLRHDPAIATLLQVEDILQTAQAKHDLHTTAAATPRLRVDVRVAALDYDLANLTQALATGATAKPSPTFYATRGEENGAVRLNQISPFLANILNLHGKGRTNLVASSIRQEFGIADADDVSHLEQALTETLRSERWVQ